MTAGGETHVSLPSRTDWRERLKARGYRGHSIVSMNAAVVAAAVEVQASIFGIGKVVGEDAGLDLDDAIRLLFARSYPSSQWRERYRQAAINAAWRSQVGGTDYISAGYGEDGWIEATLKNAHPVQSFGYQQRRSLMYPQCVTRRAYEVYAKRFGAQPALVTGGCRGGFSMGELISFLYARGFAELEWQARCDMADQTNLERYA